MAARTAESPSRSRRRATDWKDIDQTVKPRAMSSVAERRIWLRRARIAALSLAGAMVVAAALRFASFVDHAPGLLTRAGEALPVKRVTVESDGPISTDWTLRYLDWQDGRNLLDVDIAGMKSRLERVGQVRSAEVERVFPDELRIRIQERAPVARIFAQRASGEKLVLYVDAEGAVFEGIALAASTIRFLPLLDGISLSREGEGYSRIEGMGTVAKLLDESRELAPHLYRSWTVVSLAESPQIVVKGRLAKAAVFSPDEDFRTQLARLDYILDYHRGRLLSDVSRVDLTLGAQVPVTSARASR